MSVMKDVHVDAALTNFALQLPAEQDFIADLVCPIIPVMKESDKYYKFNREELKPVDTYRADGAEAKEFSWTQTTDTYSCSEHALKAHVTDRRIANSDSAIRPRTRTVTKLSRALRLARERRVQTLMQTGANWAASAHPSNHWDEASADPEADVHSARSAFLLQAGVYPNTIIINDVVRDTVVRWLKAQADGITLMEFMAADANVIGKQSSFFKGLFGIPNWIVGSSVYDSAALGVATESMARVWNDSAVLLYVDPNPDMETASAAYTFQSRNSIVKAWRDESRNLEWIETSHVLTEEIVSNLCGYMIYNVNG
jgi:hypothetical protein